MTSAAGKGSDPFLEELVAARIKRGWSQQELADEIGVSRSLVAMVETGAKQPTEETARSWARKLGISMRRFEAWMHFQQHDDIQDTLEGIAEYRYMQEDPNVTVKIADTDQIRFESGDQSGSKNAERVPLIPEGKDPDSNPAILDYVTVQKGLLKGERLERPFAYRLSAEGAKRVGRTLKPGDYAIISREAGQLERQEIYAVREPERIVLSRVFEKGPGTLLLMSDRGQEDVYTLDGGTGSLIVGKVVAAIRPLQYTVVTPTSKKGR